VPVGVPCKPSRLTSYCNSQYYGACSLYALSDANRGQEAACAMISVLEGSRIYTFVFLHKLTNVWFVSLYKAAFSIGFMGP